MEANKHQRIQTNRYACSEHVKHFGVSWEAALMTFETANTDIYVPWESLGWLLAKDQDTDLDKEETNDKNAVRRVLDPVVQMIRAGAFDPL